MFSQILEIWFLKSKFSANPQRIRVMHILNCYVMLLQNKIMDFTANKAVTKKLSSYTICSFSYENDFHNSITILIMKKTEKQKSKNAI